MGRAIIHYFLFASSISIVPKAEIRTIAGNLRGNFDFTGAGIPANLSDLRSSGDAKR